MPPAGWRECSPRTPSARRRARLRRVRPRLEYAGTYRCNVLGSLCFWGRAFSATINNLEETAWKKVPSLALSYLSFNAESAIRPSMIEMIQKRMMIFDSGMPFIS